MTKKGTFKYVRKYTSSKDVLQKTKEFAIKANKLIEKIKGI